MARGLSRLQKYILLAALKAYEVETTLTNPDICVGFYGLNSDNTEDTKAFHFYQGSGRKQYNAVKVAVFKSCRRLEERGLIEINHTNTFGVKNYHARKPSGSNYELTEEGRQIAITLEPLQGVAYRVYKMGRNYCNGNLEVDFSERHTDFI